MSKMENLKATLQGQQLFLALPYADANGDPRLISISEEDARGLLRSGSHIARAVDGKVSILTACIHPTHVPIDRLMVQK